MQKLLLTMLLSLLIPFTAVAQEAYAVYTTDGTLTFYYDKQKSSRSGTKYALNTGSNDPGWYTDHRKDIKKAVFTSSFANARPKSTYQWFSVKASEKAESALSDIVGIQYLNTSEVTNMGWMFAYCIKLKKLDVTHFNTAKVTNMSGMFCDCSSLTTLDVSNFNTNKVTSMSAMFSDCSSLTSLNVINFDTSNVTNFWYMFINCSGLKSINVSNFNTSKVTDFCAMFGGCSSLTTIDVSHFNTSNATRLNSMFSDCSSLTSLDVSSFNTSKVTGMAFMFSGCKSLRTLSINNLNSANVTTMSGMFEDCSGLISLDLSHLDTRNVTELGWMFKGCTGLKSLDLSTFNTSKVTEMNYMFDGCTSLTTIYAGNNWSTNKVSDSKYMFRGCTNLVGGAGTKYNASHVDKAYAHIDGGVSNPGYLTGKNTTPTNPINDPNLIESEDKLQKRLDEIAAEKPTNAVTLTIQDKGITIKNTIVAEIGCKAIITGGKITVSKNFTFRRPSNNVRNCIFDNHGELTFQAITIDGNSIFFENAFFSNSFGTLTIGENVSYENIYQGELRYGFYLSTGMLKVNSGNLSLNGPIFYPTHGGKVYIYGGEFRTFNEKNIVSGDDAVTIWGGKFSGGPIDIANLTIADMELGIIPELTVSSINAYNIYINRVLKLPIINLDKNGMITLNWHYRVWYPQMNYQGKWKIYSDWTEMELEKPFVVSGYEKYPVTQNDFNNMEFIDMPDDREAYYDESTKTVKLRNKATVLPTTGCDEEWLQKKLDEIAAQKPMEPVELTICPDGLTLTKSIHVDRDCKAIITGGPITSAESIEYRYGREGLFMVYGELGFKDISLNLTNDSKSDGCLGYFWLGDGKLLLGKGASVVTKNGTVVGGWGYLEVTDAVIQAGGEDMVISDQINATITDYVVLIGPKTYCNGKLSVDMKTDANTGSVMFPVFRVGQVNVSTTLDLWAPKNMLQQLYLHKDAAIKTYTDAFVQLPLTGEWEQMTLGRAFITSPSITQEDYSRMTFSGMPTNRRAEFVANSHQVRLMSASQLSIQTQLAVLNNSSAAAAVTLNLSPEAVTVVNQSSTVNHKNVTFSGMQSGSGSRGRLHFADGQTLTITSGSSLTLTDIDVTGEGSNNGFIVNGKIVIGRNVHVSDLPCLLHVGSSGRVLLSAQPVSVVTMEFIGGIANGQTIVAGTDDYHLQAADLEYIQVSGCELLLDEANNRIIAINATGIESIATDTEAKDGAADYYDLSGRRVASPRQGTYILRKGGKTRKIFIK